MHLKTTIAVTELGETWRNGKFRGDYQAELKVEVEGEVLGADDDEWCVVGVKRTDGEVLSKRELAQAEEALCNARLDAIKKARAA